MENGEVKAAAEQIAAPSSKDEKKRQFFTALPRRVREFTEKHKFLLFVLAACLISAFYGLSRCGSVEFVCTNGDYQNYNALRRALAGQVPYYDFANYLGMGPLVLCGPLLLLHNSFAASLFVTSFVACFSFMLLAGTVFYLVTGDSQLSAAGALLLPKMISSCFFYIIPGYDLYGYYITVMFDFLYKPKNSFRMARMMLPVLLCLIALCVLHFVRRRTPTEKHISLQAWLGTLKGAAITGLLVGLGLTWSNDFGFSCMITALLIMIILCIVDGVQTKQWKKACSRFLTFIPATAIGAFLSVCIATRGHIGSYFDFTGGVGSWQFWFFGKWHDEKIYGLLDLVGGLERRTWMHLLIFAGAMIFCLVQLCRRKAGDRMILLVFLYTSVVISQMGYMVGSGGDNFYEAHYGILLLISFALWMLGGLKLFRWLRAKFPKLKAAGTVARAGVMSVLVLFSAFTALQCVSVAKANKKMETHDWYVTELEGFSPDAVALREMQQVVGDQPLFSTYATALDNMKGSFQPTGCDYIIHALGDEQFDAYVQNFKENKYPFAQTTNYTVWPWEPWANGPAWGFYKELYSNYDMQGDYSYWTLWSYAGEDANVLKDAKPTVTVTQLNDTDVEILVECDTAQSCYVDVTLDWENAFTDDPARWVTWQRAVFVYDDTQPELRNGVGDGYFQPAAAEGRHLPVLVVNGKGRIVLSGQPAYCTTLRVTRAECGDAVKFVR